MTASVSHRPQYVIVVPELAWLPVVESELVGVESPPPLLVK